MPSLWWPKRSPDRLQRTSGRSPPPASERSCGRKKNDRLRMLREGCKTWPGNNYDWYFYHYYYHYYYYYYYYGRVGKRSPTLREGWVAQSRNQLSSSSRAVTSHGFIQSHKFTLTCNVGRLSCGHPVFKGAPIRYSGEIPVKFWLYYGDFKILVKFRWTSGVNPVNFWKSVLENRKPTQVISQPPHGLRQVHPTHVRKQEAADVLITFTR